MIAKSHTHRRVLRAPAHHRGRRVAPVSALAAPCTEKVSRASTRHFHFGESTSCVCWRDRCRCERSSAMPRRGGGAASFDTKGTRRPVLGARNRGHYFMNSPSVAGTKGRCRRLLQEIVRDRAIREGPAGYRSPAAKELPTCAGPHGRWPCRAQFPVGDSIGSFWLEGARPRPR